MSVLKKLNYMLDALEDKETNFRFEEGGRGGKRVNRTLNRIRVLFEKEKAEVRAQEAYYGQMLDQVRTGVVVVEAPPPDARRHNAQVLYLNRRAQVLLGVSSLSTLKQLENISPSLYEAFSKVEEGADQKASFYTERTQVNLSLAATAARIEGQAVKIVTLNDISAAIEENETESWTRLIRVLTHEIMNTVTPIASLSDALLNSVGPDGKVLAPEDLRAGLETISASSHGLIKFVNSYRGLTRVPAPVKKAFMVRELVEKVLDLSAQALKEGGTEASFVEKTEDVLLYADEGQISQILINLVKNAVQAGARQIRITADLDIRDSVVIEVANDGAPISPASQEEIFIPFFTTKQDGSGIGLSLSRQIMRLHGGTLRLTRSDDKGTVFSLLFR